MIHEQPLQLSISEPYFLLNNRIISSNIIHSNKQALQLEILAKIKSTSRASSSPQNNNNNNNNRTKPRHGLLSPQPNLSCSAHFIEALTNIKAKKRRKKKTGDKKVSLTSTQSFNRRSRRASSPQGPPLSQETQCERGKHQAGGRRSNWKRPLRVPSHARRRVGFESSTEETEGKGEREPHLCANPCEEAMATRAPDGRRGERGIRRRDSGGRLPIPARLFPVFGLRPAANVRMVFAFAAF